IRSVVGASGEKICQPWVRRGYQTSLVAHLGCGSLNLFGMALFSTRSWLVHAIMRITTASSRMPANPRRSHERAGVDIGRADTAVGLACHACSHLARVASFLAISPRSASIEGRTPG